ncbi:hypothetical protein HaLaN_17219, partial [Haematococcus lacustris]
MASRQFTGMSLVGMVLLLAVVAQGPGQRHCQRRLSHCQLPGPGSLTGRSNLSGPGASASGGSARADALAQAVATGR